jgi:protocatechuate 3,4-dioxygenase beta subunit
MRVRIAAFAAALLVSLPALASITGVVMTRDGKPVAGARVALYSLETADARRERLVSKTPERPPLVTATTDSKGTYTLESPKDAVVDLRIDKDGYAPSALRIERDEEVGATLLVPAAAKQGTVTANGKGVAGATVVWSDGSVTAIATTDANGRYTIADPSKWANRVMVFHPDFAIQEDFSPVARPSIDRKLDAGVVVTGRVMKGSTPVAKAVVLIDNYPSAESAEDGSFTVPHAPKNWRGVLARSGDQIAFAARGTKAVVLKLEPSSSVSGTVRDASTQKGVAGAEVRLTRPMRGEIVASAITDAKGNYSIGGFAPDAYTLTPSRPGYAFAGGSVSVTAGQRVQRPFAGSAEARISGMVVDEEKKPVAAAVVSAQGVAREGGPFMMRQGGRSRRPGVSGPDGRYSVRTAAEGDVQIEAVRTGYPAARSSTLHLTAGERRSGIVVTIPRGIAVSGRVTDRDGKPLSGVSVSAAESRGGPAGMRRMVIMDGDSEDDSVRTASDGSFTIRLKEGSYDVGFRREGYAARSVRALQVGDNMKPLEVTLDPGVEITGRVTRGGRPIESVSVNALSEDGPHSTTTDSDGHFVIADLTPGTTMVNFTRPEEFIQQMRSLTAPARDVSIEIPPGGRISGRVVDKSTHKPITAFQAGVSGTRSGGGMVFAMPPQMRSFTSEDGSFALDNVPTGQIEVLASAPGYITAKAGGVVVEEGKAVENLELALETGVRLFGRVTGPTGEPLSGAVVRPRRERGMVMVMTGPENVATTDANGEYSIDTLEPGEKTFEIIRSGYLTESKSVELSGRETRLDVQLSQGLRISGQVVTEAGAGVADALVSATSAATSGRPATRTDAAGAFTFENLAPGHYTFVASKQGFADGRTRDVDITAGGVVRVTLKTGSVIYGHLSGVTEAELQDATVRAMGPGGAAEAAVDANGNYRIEGAPSGSVRVSADVGRGFRERRSSAVKTVEVEAGSSAQVDIEFESQTSIRGRVTRNGTPLSNAGISFNPRGPGVQTNARTTTDGNGYYAVSGLSDGRYSVTVVDFERLTPYQTTYEVKGAGTFDIDMRTTLVRGRVTDAASGDAIAGATIQVRRTDDPSPMSMRGVTTDSSGTFVVESMTAGSYVFTAQKEGYGNLSRDLSVTESGASDVEFKLSRNEGITIRVIDARDQRLLDGRVTVFDAQGRAVVDNRFFLDSTPQGVHLSLSPGTYRATVWAEGYAPRTVSLVSPSKPTIALTPGGQLTLRVKSGGTERVRLVDANGQPYGRGPSIEGNFTVNGVASLQNVAAGVYSLQVLGPGNSVKQTLKVTVAEGQATNVEF